MSDIKVTEVAVKPVKAEPPKAVENPIEQEPAQKTSVQSASVFTPDELNERKQDLSRLTKAHLAEMGKTTQAQAKQGWLGNTVNFIKNVYDTENCSDKLNDAAINSKTYKELADLRKNYDKLSPEEFAKKYEAIRGKSLDADRKAFAIRPSIDASKLELKANTDISKKTEAYIESQKKGVETAATVGTAVVITGTAMATGGMSLVATVAIGAAAGGSAKVALKGSDAISGGNEYDLADASGDLAKGAIDGAMGGVAGKVCQGVSVAASSIMSKPLASIAGGAASGAVVGGVTNPFHGAVDSGSLDNVGKDAIVGTVSGAVVGGTISAVGQGLSALVNKFTSTEVPTSSTKQIIDKAHETKSYVPSVDTANQNLPDHGLSSTSPDASSLNYTDASGAVTVDHSTVHGAIVANNGVMPDHNSTVHAVVAGYNGDHSSIATQTILPNGNPLNTPHINAAKVVTDLSDDVARLADDATGLSDDVAGLVDDAASVIPKPTLLAKGSTNLKDALPIISKPNEAKAFVPKLDGTDIGVYVKNGKNYVANIWNPESPYEVKPGSLIMEYGKQVVNGQEVIDRAVCDPVVFGKSYVSTPDLKAGSVNYIDISKLEPGHVIDVTKRAVGGYMIVPAGTEVQTLEGVATVKSGQAVLIDGDGNPYVGDIGKSLLKRNIADTNNPLSAKILDKINEFSKASQGQTPEQLATMHSELIENIERARIENMGIKYPARGVVGRYTSQSAFKSDSTLVN